MREADVEMVLQRAKEKYPEARARIISDNGPQFIAKDFKEFIRVSGMTHVRTSPCYLQSNGNLERWHKTLKREYVFDQTAQTLFSRQESWLKSTFTITTKTGFKVLSDMLHPGINSKDEKIRFSSKGTRNWKRPERVDYNKEKLKLRHNCTKSD